MKIALIGLNSFPLNGETSFAIHMKDTYKRLGHQCDIVCFNKRGRIYKESDSTDAGVIWMKDNDVDKVVGNYDTYLFYDGRFKSKDYTFLTNFNSVGRKFLMIHAGVPALKDYNLNILLNLIKFDMIYTVEEDSIALLSNYSKAKIVELPFSKLAMPELEDINNFPIIIPSRFTFCKYIGECLELISKLNDTGMDLKADIYRGGSSGFVAFSQGFIDNMDKLSDAGIIKINNSYCFKDKGKIYSRRKYMLDGTRIKKLGRNRMQYCFFDAMFYKMVPITRKMWLNDHFIFLDFNADEIIRSQSQIDDIIDKNYENLEYYDSVKILEKYFYETLQ